MVKNRLVPVIIIRDGRVVQSIQFKHTNVIHNSPEIAIDFFDRWSADEIVVLDVSRTKENRQLFLNSIEAISHKCFVPLTVGGWIESTEDMRQMLRLGADKIAINTKAVENPSLITEGEKIFGAQCIVVSVDVFRHSEGRYEVYIGRGQIPTGLDPVSWVKEAESRGAGEILLNCINNDGFRQGYDLTLLKAITHAVSIPVVAMGGVFEWKHLADGITIGGASAVAAANIFHYTEFSTRKAKAFLRDKGLNVRP